MSKRRGRNWVKSMADTIIASAKRRNRFRIRGRRGVIKTTATTTTTTTKAAAVEKRNQSSWLIDRLPPEVLLIGILSTLPVKSLLQLRFVCKSLYHIISDTYFVKTHLNRTITSPNLLRRRQHIFLRSSRRLDIPYAVSLEAAADKVDGDIVASGVKIDFLVEFKEHCCDYCYILGSCNGLLCLGLGQTALYMFNLSTRESKTIPPVPDYLKSHNLYIFGFGYVHSADDYKLVAADKKGFYVYSLRSDSWKKVQGLPNNHPSLSSSDGTLLNGTLLNGTLLNGAIHWLCLGQIIAFSLADEKFWEFPAPTLSHNNIPHTLRLLGGCLCIVPMFGREFWVMKEYGGAQSWTKDVIAVPFFNMNTLALLENDEAILRIGSQKLVLYNTRERTYRDLVLRDFPDVTLIRNTGAYVESLVSPCHGNLS